MSVQSSRGGTLNAREWTEARKMYLNGYTYEQIGKKYGVCLDTVYRRAKKEGWTREDLRKIRSKAMEEAERKTKEMLSNKIAKINDDLMQLGDGILNVAKAQLNACIKDLNDNKPINMADFKKLTDIYHTVTHDMRLQTGQTTSNNKNDNMNNVRNTEKIIYLPERDPDPAEIEKKINNGVVDETSDT
jgi:hypothetical protein